MIVHNLKIAYRNLLKYKMQSAICVLGLAIGLACFTVCNYLLREELTWNKQLAHWEDTYNLVSIEKDGHINTMVSADLAIKLKKEFPEIEKMVYYVSMGGVTDKVCVVDQKDGSKTFTEGSFFLTDSLFFDFYDFRLTVGNWEKLKKQPNVMILTSEGAKKIFSGSVALGKSFTEVNDFEKIERPWVVAAIMKNFPRASDFGEGFGVVLNPDELHQQRYRYFTHVRYRLREGTSYEMLNQKIAGFMEKHPEWKRNQPLIVKVYPYKDYYKLTGKGRLSQNALTFSGIGFLVLLAALFNYMLYTTGRMFNRQRELGIREVNGATSATMFRMFMVEVTMTLLITGVIAAATLELLSGYFKGQETFYLYFAGKGNWLAFMGGYLLEYLLILWGMMMVIGYGIVRKVKRATMLRNLQEGGITYHARLQTVFLSIQLIICMFLIGLTWFMQAQQRKMETQMTGRLTKEEMEEIYSFGLNGESLEPVRQEIFNMLAVNPYVEKWCRTSTSLLSPWLMYPQRYNVEGMEEEKKIPIAYNGVDPGYNDFIHARMEEGRFFTADEPDAMVVNRAFADWLGENPIGKTFTADNIKNIQTYRIVGIMENVLPVTSNPKIQPCVYVPYTEHELNQRLYVKFKHGSAKQGIQPLKAKMEAQVSSFTRLYIEDIWMDMKMHLSPLIELSRLILGLAIICLIISSLGLYSAMMLAVEKRSREMAIRKINGATLSDITKIFCYHYFKLLLVTAVVAFPLIYWVMSQWLEGYNSRISLSPEIFVGIFVVMVFIILLTILSQLLKIIRVNPTEALKRE